MLTREKLTYTVAMFGLGLCSTTVVQWLMFYYAPPAEIGREVYLGAAVFGTTMALGRLVDAGVDPLIGFYSDRTHTAYGRRKPFMAAALPLYAVSFILLWFPPSSDPSFINLLWVIVFLSLFFTSLSIFAVPYLALLPEIVPSDKERVLVALFQSIWFVSGAAVGAMAPALLMQVVSFHSLIIIFAVLSFSLMFVTVINVKERFDFESGIKFAPPRKVFLAIKRNKTFLYWALTLFFLWSGASIIVMLVPYFGHIFLQMHRPDLISVGLAAAALVIILVTLYFTYKAVIKYGKWTPYFICLFASAALMLLISTTDAYWMPINPQAQLTVLTMLLLPALIIPLVLQNAVTAEIAERHERKEGLHQEALIFAAQGLTVKLALGTAAISLGFILDLYVDLNETAIGLQVGSILAAIYLFAAAAFVTKCKKTL